MPKFKFNLRNAKSAEPTPVNFIVRWGNRRLVYSTGETIEPSYWCGTPGQRNFQRAKETRAFPEHPEFNERLDSLLTTAKATFRQFTIDNKREPEPAELRDALDLAIGRSNNEQHSDLLAYIGDFVARTKENVNPHSGKRMHPTTHGRNRIVLRYLQAYVHSTRKGSRIPFSAVDAAFLDGFSVYLTKTLGLAVNTVGKYLRAFRMFMNTAVEDGMEVNKGFRSRRFIIPEERTEQIYLTENELNDLFHLDLSANRRLDRSRDLFLIGAWTGLRFGDLTSLSAAHIEGNRIRIRANKTERSVVIPLHPVVSALLAKYGGEMPAPLSNQKLNAYIKEIGGLVPSLQVSFVSGITRGGVRKEVVSPKWQLISTHTARRSFASNLYRRGIQAQTIMAITGHRTESAFLRYVRLDGEQHADMIAASNLFNHALMREV
jgi:integrase